jgi:hypothetical protein
MKMTTNEVGNMQMSIRETSIVTIDVLNVVSCPAVYLSMSYILADIVL